MRWVCGETLVTIALFVLCSAASKDLAVVAVEGDLALGRAVGRGGPHLTVACLLLIDTQRRQEPRENVVISVKPSGSASDSQM